MRVEENGEMVAPWEIGELKRSQLKIREIARLISHVSELDLIHTPALGIS